MVLYLVLVHLLVTPSCLLEDELAAAFCMLKLPLEPPFALGHLPPDDLLEGGGDKGSHVSVNVKARKCCELKHKENEGCSRSGGARIVSYKHGRPTALLTEMCVPGRYAMVSHMGNVHSLLGRYLKQLTKDLS